MNIEFSTRAVALAALLALHCTHAGAGDSLQPHRPILPGDSILVVSPHPDDESLCCGGLIHMARGVGARVSVVWVTYGDGFRWSAMVAERRVVPRAGTYRDLARKRGEEARAAAAILKLQPESLYFLGYPDRGVLPLLLDHYYPDTPWRSKFTRANEVIYTDALNTGSTYDGESLEHDFRQVLERVKPTLVLAPSPQDTHPDHRGAGILAWRAMSNRKELDRIRFWIVHGGRGWPKPRAYHPELQQTIAPRGLGMRWERFTVDPDSRVAKLQAIRAHRSQTAVMGRVMESYARADELYSRTPTPPRSVCALPEPCDFEEQPLMEKSGF